MNKELLLKTFIETDLPRKKVLYNKYKNIIDISCCYNKHIFNSYDLKTKKYLFDLDIIKDLLNNVNINSNNYCFGISSISLLNDLDTNKLIFTKIMEINSEIGIKMINLLFLRSTQKYY